MKNPLPAFIAGLVMLTAGLFLLTSIVQVSSYWGAGWHIGGVNIAGGFTQNRLRAPMRRKAGVRIYCDYFWWRSLLFCCYV